MKMLQKLFVFFMFSALPFASLQAQDTALNKQDILYIDVKSGRIAIQLRPDLAPGHVARINKLTREGFYNGIVFHRVMAGFMAQTGDPQGTGSGGSKRIRTAILHVILNLVDYGTSIEEAVCRPRIFVDNGHLSVEGGYEVAQVERLVERYPEHRVWDDINLFFGGAHTVERRGMSFEGAGDPRRAGVCRVAGGRRA